MTETAVYNIWLDKNDVRELQLIPAIVQFGGQPRLATPEESISIQQAVCRLTYQPLESMKWSIANGTSLTIEY